MSKGATLDLRGNDVDGTSYFIAKDTLVEKCGMLVAELSSTRDNLAGQITELFEEKEDLLVAATAFSCVAHAYVASPKQITFNHLMRSLVDTVDNISKINRLTFGVISSGASTLLVSDNQLRWLGL